MLFEDLISHVSPMYRSEFAQQLLEFVLCVIAEGENSTEAGLRRAQLNKNYPRWLSTGTLFDIQYEAESWRDEIVSWLCGQNKANCASGE